MPALTPKNPALEQQIVEAPDDPLPRQVYGDWLQSIGDKAGEWVALALADAPREVRLQFLVEHRDALLGQGSEILTNGWIGWRHGFADEVRLQAVSNAKRRLAALFDRPIGRFARCVAIGRTPSPEEAVQAVVDAKLPLLEEVVAVDDYMQGQWRFDALAQLPGLTRLGLFGASIDAVMPQLKELAIYVPSVAALWVARGACPNVEVLTLHCHIEPTPLPPILDALPALRALHVVNANREERVHAELAPFARRRIAIDVAGNAEPWVAERLRGGGRDALRMVPSAGGYLVNAAWGSARREASAFLAAATTLPTPTESARTWRRAAMACVQERRFADAVYLAREAIELHAITDAGVYAVLLVALRRLGEREQAAALVPAALGTLGQSYQDQSDECLIECLITLGWSARWQELVEASAMFPGRIPERGKEALALAYVATGQAKEAKALAGKSPTLVVAKARAMTKPKPADIAALFAEL